MAHCGSDNENRFPRLVMLAKSVFCSCKRLQLFTLYCIQTKLAWNQTGFCPSSFNIEINNWI